MAFFDDEQYYDDNKYGELDFDQHMALFLRIRNWAVEAPKNIRYNKSLYRKYVLKKIEEVAGYACSGHIPAQDYMGYIYKRGFGDFFPINYRRALEWNIIAAKNGSKLAPQKMKVFLNPAIDMIFLSPRFPIIVKYNDINRSNYFWFLSQYICDVLYKEMKLNPGDMAKKELIEEDTNQNSTIIYLDRYRDRVVTKAIEQLVKELPEEAQTDGDVKNIVNADDLDNPDGDNGDDIDIDEI